MAKILGFRPVILLGSIGLGISYGLFMRFLFKEMQYDGFLQIMSTSFIFLVPLIVGFITIFLWPDKDSLSVAAWILYPWITAILMMCFAILLLLEGLICVIIWLPIGMIMASVGGVIAGIVHRINLSNTSRNMVFGFFLIIPIILSPLEQQLATKTMLREVKTSIEIHADATTIWKNIKEVPVITPEEQGFSIAHTLGFPKPIEAKLIGEGIGAVREATFEGRVLFVETVTEWVPLERLSFSIEPSPDIPPTTFDEHVVVGGAYFDVLSGTYQVESVGPNHFRLHLSSEHQLSTHFNGYTRLWTDFFMGDIQRHILNVIKSRCEAQT